MHKRSVADADYPWLGALDQPTEHQLPNADPNGSVLMIPAAALLEKQYRGGTFNRLDLAVRWLAVDAHFGRNTDGWELYRHMQQRRVNVTDGEVRFRALIRSMHQRGFDPAHPIEVDAGLHLFDGSHRLAISLYLGFDCVHVRRLPEQKDVRYDLGWFHDAGFSSSECRMIESAAHRMQEAAAQRTVRTVA